MKIHHILAASVVAFASLSHAQTAQFSVEPAHSFVYWEANHQNISTLRGRFDKTRGSMTYDAAAKTGTADIIIDTTSISTGMPAFNEHLKQKGWLNAVEFPEAKFIGKKFVFDGANLKTVEGELTFMGKTLPIALIAKRFGCYVHPKNKKDTCGGDFEYEMKRSAWGSTAGIPGDPDMIKLLIEIEGQKQ